MLNLISSPVAAECALPLLDTWRTLVDQRLSTVLPTANKPTRAVQAALHYAVLDGHRWRPLLLMATCHSTGRDASDVIEAACSIELIHCCTIILDDLPCVDNAPIRRGRPTCHCVFGDATTIYASHLLFGLAERIACNNASELGILPNSIRDHFYSLRQRLIDGQQIEVNLSKGILRPSDNILTRLYQLKSSPFISATWLGLALSRVTIPERRHIMRYARYLGMIYQLVDDMLDVIANPSEIGKLVGVDTDKLNLVTHAGVENAYNIIRCLLRRAESTLTSVPGDTVPLRTLMRNVINPILNNPKSSGIQWQ